MSTTVDPRVTDYLNRLRECGGVLPPDEFEDVWQSVHEHLDEAAERGEPIEQALARLGPPEAIVAAAAGQTTTQAPAAQPQPRRRLRGVDIAALVLLQVGAVVFGLGWIAGVLLLWISDRWRWWEKLLGTLVVPGGLAGLVFVGGLATWNVTACSSGGSTAQCTASTAPVIARIVLGLLAAATIAVTVYLARAARPGRGGQPASGPDPVERGA